MTFAIDDYPSEGFLKELFGRAAAGDRDAVTQLWDYYYPKLKTTVARRIQRMPRLAGDASDLTSAALHDFLSDTIRAAGIDLSDVNKVWSLMRLVSLRHINDVAKHRYAEKRGGHVETYSLDAISGRDGVAGDDEPADKHLAPIVQDKKAIDPSDPVVFEELVERLLARLPDDTSRHIVLLRLQNQSTGEIADLMQISIRTVQRHLKEVERIWLMDHGQFPDLGESVEFHNN